MAKKDCSVVILAAGDSSRMGRPKFLLKMPDGELFLESLTHQYAEFGCSSIIIVLNKEGVQSIQNHQLKLPPQTQIILNHHPEIGRFNSIKCGLERVSQHWFFIHNIDNPFAKRDVLEQLFQAKSDADVVKPVINGKGGHPVLLSGKVRDSILNEHKNDYNLKIFLTAFNCREVTVKDETILINLNTYEEYLEFYRR